MTSPMRSVVKSVRDFVDTSSHLSASVNRMRSGVKTAMDSVVRSMQHAREKGVASLSKLSAEMTRTRKVSSSLGHVANTAKKLGTIGGYITAGIGTGLAAFKFGILETAAAFEQYRMTRSPHT